MGVIIEVKNLDKVYGNKVVLDRFNCKINEGDFLMITGESGIGKSTLLNIISLVDKPTGGEVLIEDEPIDFNDLEQLSEIRLQKIGIVFQMYYLIPRLSVKENIMVPCLYRKKKNEIDTERQYFELVNLLKLNNLENQYVENISGGEKQRVAIARALITNPKVLICDEPTGNLDSTNTNIIMGILKQLHEKGITIIMVTHNLDLIKFASKVINFSGKKKNEC